MEGCNGRTMAQAARPPENKRKHPRIKTNLRGRYMLPDRREFPCTIVDVAVGGIAVTGPEPGAIGDNVIVYMDELGRVEGQIVRFVEGGFAVALTSTTRATEKMARRLDELQAHGEPSEAGDRRREPRVDLEGEVAPVTMQDGAEAEIVDLSVTGAEIKIKKRPAVGSLVQLGRVKGRVVRHTKLGVAVEFVEVRNDATLTEQLTQISLPAYRQRSSA